jgi:hypothetical protein
MESRTLFAPGRSSYLDKNGELQLSNASARRARVAAWIFNPGIHDRAVFAGGFPGLTQGWKIEPPAHRREGPLMSIPLIQRLQEGGMDDALVADIVRSQGDSSDTFGDVIESIKQGLFDVERFQSDPDHDLEIVAGFTHGLRIREIAATGLGIDKRRIHRVHMRDVYGAPASLTHKRELAPMALAMELGAIVVANKVLDGVAPGDLRGLEEAHQAFNLIAAKHASS